MTKTWAPISPGLECGSKPVSCQAQLRHGGQVLQCGLETLCPKELSASGKTRSGWSPRLKRVPCNPHAFQLRLRRAPHPGSYRPGRPGWGSRTESAISAIVPAQMGKRDKDFFSRQLIVLPLEALRIEAARLSKAVRSPSATSASASGRETFSLSRAQAEPAGVEFTEFASLASELQS